MKRRREWKFLSSFKVLSKFNIIFSKSKCLETSVKRWTYTKGKVLVSNKGRVLWEDRYKLKRSFHLGG